MFLSDLERLRALLAYLHSKRDNQLAFEERFRVLRVHYALEDLLAHHVGVPGEFHYCFFANATGVRHLSLTPEDARVALKIQTQEALLPTEKERGLRLLCRLAQGPATQLLDDGVETSP